MATMRNLALAVGGLPGDASDGSETAGQPRAAVGCSVGVAEGPGKSGIRRPSTPFDELSPSSRGRKGGHGGLSVAGFHPLIASSLHHTNDRRQTQNLNVRYIRAPGAV